MITNEDIAGYILKYSITEPTCVNCGCSTIKRNKTGKLQPPSTLKSTCSRLCAKEYSITNRIKEDTKSAIEYLESNKLEYINDAISIYIHKSNMLSYPKCTSCGSDNMYIYKELTNGDRVVTSIKKYCSNSCSSKNTSVDRLQKAKVTNLLKYGVDNPMKSELIKEKVKQSNIEKYGVDNPMKNPNISNKSSTRKRELFNVEEHREKIKNRLEHQRLEQITNWDNILKDKNISVSSYTNASHSIQLQCNSCSTVSDWSVSHLHKLKHLDFAPCKKCNSNKLGGGKYSKIHLKVVDFLKEHNIDFVENTFILGNREIDIYIPNMNIGFEINGLYWHSSERLGKEYHKMKTLLAKDIGIKLIHLWEDDINYKFEIVKSMILNTIGKSKRIFARNTTVVELSNNITTSFLKENHIQGTCNSKTRLGLIYDKKIVAIMTFGKNRFENGSTELIRFCNILNTTVVGGASKLLKYYTRNFKYERIISFSNSDFSDGNLYNKLGFDFIKDTPPTLYWTKHGIRENRMKYQKHKLDIQPHEENLTASEIMKSRGFFTIHGVGNKKYEYNEK